MTEEERKLDSVLVRGGRRFWASEGDFALVLLLCGCCELLISFAKDTHILDREKVNELIFLQSLSFLLPSFPLTFRPKFQRPF